MAMTYEETKKIFCERFNLLVELRHNSATIDDVAKGCGVSECTYRNYRRGEALPDTRKLLDIADYFCVSVDYLLGRCEMDTEYYKLDMRKVVEESYARYLGSNRNNPTNAIGFYNDNCPSYVCPVWPYNLLDAIQHSPKIDDPRVIDYPITSEQMDGLMWAIDSLTDREQLCVLEYFKDEHTLEEVGYHHGVTRERIRQVIAKAVRKLRHPSRFKVIQYGTAILEFNKQKEELQAKKAQLAREILEVDKEIVEVGKMKGEVAVDKERIEEARQNVFTTQLIEMDLSVRSYNSLTRVGCKTMADVIPKIEDDTIVRVRNLGRKSVKEIATKLLDLGYESEKCYEYASL